LAIAEAAMMLARQREADFVSATGRDVSPPQQAFT